MKISLKKEARQIFEVKYHTRWIQSFSNVKTQANPHVSVVNEGMHD